VLEAGAEAWGGRAGEEPAPRAERVAAARDARAWAALEAAVARYEDAIRRMGASGAPVSGATFRHELGRELQEAPAERAPDGAGAVRIAAFGELAGEPLDLLVVVDANQGALPAVEPDDAIFPEQLATRLRA